MDSINPKTAAARHSELAEVFAQIDKSQDILAEHGYAVTITRITSDTTTAYGATQPAQTAAAQTLVVMEDIMRTSGEGDGEMETVELHRKLEERGIKILKGTMSGYLSNNKDRFTMVRKGRWKPAREAAA